MIFHFCKAGESLLSIAREYGVSPVRLIEENALADPDRLAVGQCLVIYRSAKSYTVRGGDTLQGICRRFHTSEQQLIMLNPAIGEKHLLYPGQILSLARAEPPMGCLSVNGIVSSDASVAKIKNFASALTYLTITSDRLEYRSGRVFPKCNQLIDFCTRKGVLPLLSYPASGIRQSLLDTLSQSGYRGIVLSAKSIKKEEKALSEFLSKAKSMGLVVGIRGPLTDELRALRADFIIPEPGSFMSFAAYCEALCNDDDEDLCRLMPEVSALPSEMVDGRFSESKSSHADCMSLAYKRNVPIGRDRNGAPYLHFSRMLNGTKVDTHLVFEDLFSIKKGLTQIGESGMPGISLYPETAMPSVCTMLHQCFDVIKEGDGTSGVHSLR